jgi:hypothetical protein
MPKATRKLVPQATWSGKRRPLHKDAQRVVPVDARRTIELLLSWYFEAEKAEHDPWRPRHYRLELERLAEGVKCLRMTLKDLSRPARVALERNDVDVLGILHDLEHAENVFPGLLDEIKGESRGAPKKRAFSALVNGLDRVWLDMSASQENRGDGKGTRRTKEHRAFV